MANPLAPLPPEPMLRHKPKKAEADARVYMRRILWPMGGATIIGIAVGSMPLLMVAAVVWTGWAVYYVLLTRVLDPRGEDTPYVNQHSQIQAMVMRGEHAKAAQAYRDAIAADPADVLACEQLVQHARVELKDYELAIWAAKEAERRNVKIGRKLTFGMMAVELYRDYLKDPKRAVVELRRLLATYPTAPNAGALKAELDQLKAYLFESE